MSTLESRIAALESSNRRLRNALIAVALAAISPWGFGLMKQTPPDASSRTPKTPEAIRARKFILVDTRGHPRAELGPASGGQPALTLLDRKGLHRCTVTLDKRDNGNILFRDQNESMRATLSCDRDGFPGLALCSETGRAQMILSSDADGAPSLEFFDDEGNSRAVTGISSDGFAGLQVRDGEGRRRAALAVDNLGEAGLTLRDAKGTLRLFVESTASGRSSLSLSDASGTIRAMLSAPDRGPAWLTILNKHARTVWSTVYPIPDEDSEEEKDKPAAK